MGSCCSIVEQKQHQRFEQTIYHRESTGQQTQHSPEENILSEDCDDIQINSDIQHHKISLIKNIADLDKASKSLILMQQHPKQGSENILESKENEERNYFQFNESSTLTQNRRDYTSDKEFYLEPEVQTKSILKKTENQSPSPKHCRKVSFEYLSAKNTLKLNPRVKSQWDLLDIVDGQL